MTDTNEDHTHRVKGGQHVRSQEGDARGKLYEVGDPITPTEAELASLPDRFEPIDDETAESGATSGSDEDTTEDTRPEEAAAETAEADLEDQLTAEAIEAANYQDLQQMAAEYDDVSGNWSKDRLKAELLDRV